MRHFSSCDHRRRIRARPAIEQLHRVHLSIVDTYSPLPTRKPGTDGNLLARAGGPNGYSGPAGLPAEPIVADITERCLREHVAARCNAPGRSSRKVSESQARSGRAVVAPSPRGSGTHQRPGAPVGGRSILD